MTLRNSLLARSIASALVVSSAFLLTACPGPNPPGDASDVADRVSPDGSMGEGGMDGSADGTDGTVNPDGSDGQTDGGTDGGTDGSTDGGTVVTICPGDALPRPATGTCTVTAGSNALLITGDILTPGQVFRGGQVAVDTSGQIQCVGCDCSASPAAAGATTIVCPDGVVSPGLINAHDHMTFTQGRPYTLTDERYEQRHDWRRGQRNHTRLAAPGGASNDQMSWGELRFVMGGATSVNGSGGVRGFLRNLDSAAQEEGLGQPAVDYDTFPLGDSDGTQLASTCAYPSINTASAIAGDDSYTPHVSEGIDSVARNEYLCMRMGANDLVQPQSAFIHGVALLPPDIADLAATGTALIWSPRSNVTLYGDTAHVTEYARLGVSIALGSDWVISGSMNMLRELACADSLNSNYYDHFFSDEQLWLMATRDAAAALAVDDATGVLATGHVADIAIFDASVHHDHRAVIDAQAQDVVLVLRNGVPLYGDDALITTIPSAGTGCDTIDVCGTAKRACVSRETSGRTLAQLQTANSSAYPLFFCGTPMGEPSCVPARTRTMVPYASIAGSTLYTGVSMADDRDGDGIADAADNCPRVFNAIRPVDNGMQGDVDHDGVGDACDPCPLDADSTTCSAPNPDDRDHDGVTNGSDNCPDIANPMQEDMDHDMIGDACDACPMVANPGGTACPVTIYAIKHGDVMAGAHVSITDGIVTGVQANGFFMQVDPSSTGYMGAAYSGIFIFTRTAPTATRGDHVRVTDGVVTDFFGQRELTNPVYMVTSSGAMVAPTDVTPAEVTTGGARAGELESVLVRVSGVTVDNVDPPVGAGDTAPIHEFVVNGLRVDDAIYLTTPFPVVGESFASITGVLALAHGDSKVLPRAADDLVSGGASLAPFAAGPYFVTVGSVGTPTIPRALTVSLARAAATDTFVTVTSGDPTSLTVVGGGVTIVAGATSAPVLFDGLASAAGVTVTASVGTSMQTASVTVYDEATTMPSITGLTPPTATTSVGSTVTFTVSLDFPAPAGGVSVTLSASAGTVPATVTVPAGQLSATFDFVAVTVMPSAMVTATLGASSATATVNVGAAAVGALMINEVDYSQPGADTSEFIEILNTSGSPIDLTNYAVALVNGSLTPPAQYISIPLGPAGTLMPGQYLVLATTTLTVPASALRINFANPQDNVQNGAPDGLALVDTSTHTVIDALSYEGAIMMATIPGFTMPVNLVEGTVLPTATADSDTATASLCRMPNGTDTNNAATDWHVCNTVTPGAANAP